MPVMKRAGRLFRTATIPRRRHCEIHCTFKMRQDRSWSGGEDFIVSVVYSEDMPNYDTFQNAWDDMAAIF